MRLASECLKLGSENGCTIGLIYILQSVAEKLKMQQFVTKISNTLRQILKKIRRGLWTVEADLQIGTACVKRPRPDYYFPPTTTQTEV